MTKGRRAAERRREREQGKGAGGETRSGGTSPDGAPKRSEADADDEPEEQDAQAQDEDAGAKRRRVGDDDVVPQARIVDEHHFVEARSEEALPEVSARAVSRDDPSIDLSDDDVDPDAATRSRLALPSGLTAAAKRAKKGRRARVEENPDVEAAFQAELKDGDDAAAFDEVTVEREAPAKERSRGGRFLVVAGPDAGQKISLVHTAVTIGRTASADVNLSDPAVSLSHAELTYSEELGFTLLDLGSTSGTLLNGRPVLDEVELKHGDLVALGRSELRFLRARDAPLEKPPPPPPPKEPTVVTAASTRAEATSRDPSKVYDRTEVAPPPATGQRARPLVHAVLAVMAIVLVGSAIGIGYSLGWSEANPEQVAFQMETLKIDAVGALKRHDIDGARARCDTMLALDPGNVDATSILKMVDTETAARQALGDARRLADDDRGDEAHAALKRIPDASVFAGERDTVKAMLRVRAVAKSRSRVQELVKTGRTDEAQVHLRGHLEVWPDDDDAKQIEAQISSETTTAAAKAALPDPSISRARAAFASGDTGAARAAAASGGGAGRTYLEDLERFERALDEGGRALSRKDGLAAVAPYDEAWRLVQRLGGGKDGPIARSMKKPYADALYLAGAAELDGGDACQGARRILLAADLAPDDPKVKAKLRDVVTDAEQGLARARSASDPARQKSIARDALCGAPRGSPTYRELASLAR